MALFANGLLPASFRGAPFAVLADEVGGGRRIAMHQYPGRDVPWAEDMGRAARSYRFRGFITDGDVSFAGGPIQLQRALLLAVLEKAGSGTLTHPTLGVLDVSVSRFALGQDLGAGRMSTLDVEFVESGKQTFPSLLSSSSGLLSASNLAKLAVAVTAVRAIAALASLATSRRSIEVTTSLWSAQTVAQRDDATALHRLAAQLTGGGRFAGGANTGLDVAIVSPIGTTIADLVAASSKAREAVTAAARQIASVVETLDLAFADALPDAVFGLIDAIASACADPADALRLLTQLAGYAVRREEGQNATGMAIQRLFRRAIAAALVVVAGRYQPASNDEAAAVIKAIAGAVDDLATDAADAGDDDVYQALRAARAAVIEDLRRRSAPLPRVRTFTSAAPQPAIVLAQRFYRDSARAEQLVRQVVPVHPLFMPTSLQALAA
jgi:prophage DNA circulation protein